MEARTILVPGVTCPGLWPREAGVLGAEPEVVTVVVVVVGVLAGVLGRCCSRRF